MGGGMSGGLASLDTGNPWISSMMTTMLSLAAPMLPRLALFKKESLSPTLKKVNVQRERLWYGPMNLYTVAVRTRISPANELRA